MRVLRALLLGALLLTGTNSVALANTGSNFEIPVQGTEINYGERARSGDGSGYWIPQVGQPVRNGDGSGYALPQDSQQVRNGDGSGYALPQDGQPVRNGDGSGYSSPAVPTTILADDEILV